MQLKSNRMYKQTATEGCMTLELRDEININKICS
jgi:hypothetical protein